MLKNIISYLRCVLNRPSRTPCPYCGYDHRFILKRRAAEFIPAGSLVTLVDGKVKPLFTENGQGELLGIAKRDIEGGVSVVISRRGSTDDVGW